MFRLGGNRMPVADPAILAMDLDPDVFGYLVSEVPDASQRREEMRSLIAAGWPQQGGHWVIQWKMRSGLLGACCLVPMSDCNLIELGYRTLRGSVSEITVMAILCKPRRGIARC